jgi:hypothetical protein
MLLPPGDSESLAIDVQTIDGNKVGVRRDYDLIAIHEPTDNFNIG